MNTFGTIYRLTSFGESHGRAIGGIVDGLPSRSVISLRRIQQMLDARRPGQSALTTARCEVDRLQILSGMMTYDPASGNLSPLTADADTVIALGTPIGFMVENTDHHSNDYDALRHLFRPSHADYSLTQRYGIRDWRGGGRSSGRETISRVVAGSMAMQILEYNGISISSSVYRIGNISNPTQQQIEDEILAAKRDCDSVGGIVECSINGVPPGVGNPTFGKLQQSLASAIMSIGAIKGIEFGMGFEGVSSRGSEVADTMHYSENGQLVFDHNFSGGIQGGISNGMPITMRIAVKPTASIARQLNTVNDTGENVPLVTKGRHDPCLLPRIRPVIESMAAISLLDTMLLSGCPLCLSPYPSSPNQPHQI